MATNIYVDRLNKLREKMAASGIHAVMIPTADYHNSEYAAPYFGVREYFCGFTGENATLLVRMDGADLWVDGRFFIQADQQLEGTGVTVQKMGEPGVLSLHQFMKATLADNNVLAFDGRCVTKAEGIALQELLKGKNISFVTDFDAAEGIWTDRPAMPCTPAWVLDAEKYAGETTISKLNRLRKVMTEHDSKFYVSGKLDEIMWLYNIRGNDVECNPVSLSYAIVTEQDQFLFIQDAELTDEVRTYCQENHILLEHYAAFEEALAKIHYDGKVLLDPDYTSYATYLALRAAGAELVEICSPLDAMKAVKNATEIQNFRDCYIEDSAAVTKFIYWLKTNAGKIPMTEVTAAQHLDNLRAQIGDYVELSFPTISAYGPNAAMMHYEPTEENCAEIKPEGMLLVDSGGHYLRGTTDVTRTMAVGPVTDDMKKSYTLTAVSELRLQDAIFLKGSSGITLDILAREPMWREGMDYKCGTGHGIGYLLNVHEGPQSIRYRKRDNSDMAEMVPGMVVSDEPGVYKAGQYGIRIETILLCVEHQTTSDGTFYAFEPLTFVPLDRDLIDVQYLTEDTRMLLNEYHKQVYEKIAPFMTVEEKQWLAEQCAEI